MKREKQKSVMIPLKVPQDMKATIAKLAQMSRLSEADVMRMAMDRGFASVEQMFKPHSAKAA